MFILWNFMLINLNVSSFFQGPPGPSGPKGERVMCPLGSVFVTCLIHRLVLCYPLQWNDLKFLDIILFSDLLLYFKYWYFDCHIFYLGWYRTEGRIWTSGKITVLLYFKHFTYKRYYFYHFFLKILSLNIRDPLGRLDPQEHPKPSPLTFSPLRSRQK